MNQELRRLYNYSQEIVDKYPNQEDWFEDDMKKNIALIFNLYLETDLREEKALQIVLGALYLKKHFNNSDSVNNELSNLFMLLLENDPSLYTNMNKAFYRLLHTSKTDLAKELVQSFKDDIDVIQVGLKEKEYKTPFYNVTQGKYDGPYFTFNFSDPVLKQQAETKIFPKLQQVLKEKYGDQVEAELRPNGQVWLKKWSDIPLDGEIQNIVNQISMKGEE